MLKFLRKKTKVIIWTLVIAFIAWGAFAVGIQFQQGSRAPGRIFGKEVAFQDYWLASRAVEIFSPIASQEEPPSAEQLEARTWEFLVLSHEAKSQKIAVTDGEVRVEIMRLLGRGEGEVFDQEEYARWVRATLREEPREFERQVREHVRIRKLLDKVRKEATENLEEGLTRWLKTLFERAQIQIYEQRQQR